MIPSPRWRKVMRDLFQNRGRTILTIISIAVGVLAIGMTEMASNVLNKGMADTYKASQPSQFTLTTSPFQQSTVESVLKIQGVAQVESLTTLPLLINTSSDQSGPNPDTWKNIIVTALPNLSHPTMDLIVKKGGELPHQSGQIALDTTSLQFLHVKIGQHVWIELQNGHYQKVEVTGSVHDSKVVSSLFSGVVYGYVPVSELNSFSVPKAFNTLSVQVTGDRLGQSHIESVATAVRNDLRKQGLQVTSTSIPQPGKYWAYDIVHSLASVLLIIGILDAVLSVFLVFNTVLAALTSQSRQIGVMKTFGASARQLIAMYLGYVTILGLIAMMVGVPLSMIASKFITSYSVSLLGFATHGFGLSIPIFLQMFVLGIGLPMLTALYPIVASGLISIREALNSEARLTGRHSLIERVTYKIAWLPKTVALALRNTVRRKGRLVLTVATIGLGGALVMGTLTVQTSLYSTIDRSMKYTDFDIRVTLDKAQTPSNVLPVVKSVSGVAGVEGWGQAVSNIVRANGSESSDLNLLAPPPQTNYMHAQIVSGRWLTPQDTNAIVVDSFILHEEPGMHVGQSLNLDINGHTGTFKVVGLYKKVSGEVDMYVMPHELNQYISPRSGISVLNIKTTQTSASGISHIAGQIRTTLANHGYPVASVQTTPDLRATYASRFSVVMMFMKAMGILISIVSGLGLMGTQSLNVMERTREIGIFRSIGASTSAIWSIVVQEGIFIGLLGWVIACMLSVPVSHLLSNSIGQSLFLAPLNYAYDYSGILLWLGISLVISTLSSLVPARNATKLTIRDVLAHVG